MIGNILILAEGLCVNRLPLELSKTGQDKNSIPCCQLTEQVVQRLCTLYNVHRSK